MNAPQEGFLRGAWPGDNTLRNAEFFASRVVVFTHYEDREKHELEYAVWLAKHALRPDFGYRYPKVPVADCPGEFVTLWTAEEHFGKPQFGPRGEEHFQSMRVWLFLEHPSLVQWMKAGYVNRRGSFLVLPQCATPDGRNLKDSRVLATFHG